MAASEVLSMIPASEYERIKQSDPSPVFKAYVIGHEGESEGRVVGGGNVVARWVRSAIDKLYNKLALGIALFHDHAQTNEHAGRVAIGEIVGKALRTIKDRLSVIAVAYIRPEFRHLPLDVASIEADLRFIEDRKRNVYQADVDEITGIALGNSAVNKPGFAGATLLAQVQAFADGKSRQRSFQFDGGGENMTLEEIIEHIKTNKIRPSDLFGAATLVEDPIVKGFVAEAAKTASGSEYATRKRAEEEFAKTKTDLEAKVKTLEEKTAKQEVELAKGKVGPLLSKEAEARKLTDQQKKFINGRLEKVFNPTKVETLEADFKKHIDSELDEFKREAEVFGIKIEPQKEGGGDGQKKTGAEPADGKQDGTIEDKYLSPETNPFIPRA
jgi:hypothetical protein